MKSTALTVALFLLIITNTHAEKLGLQQATAMALQNDDTVKQIQHEQKALSSLSKSLGSWPDPKLKVGFTGLPKDTKDFNQIDMTQKIVGINQMLPSFGLVRHRRLETEAKSEAKAQMADNRALEVVKKVRLVWLDIYHHHHAAELIKRSKRVFRELVKITRLQYRAGRRRQHDVLRAELEYSLLADRELDMRQKQRRSLAELHRWTGEVGKNVTLDTSFPALPKVLSEKEILEKIRNHPMLAAKDHNLKAALEGVKMARSRYLPSFGVDITYGMRGGPRSDLISAVIAMDLPILPTKRQGNRVAAKRLQMDAAQNELDNAQRELVKILNMEYANWHYYNKRLDHYKKEVMPEAAQNGEATIRAYRNGVADFQEVVRSRIMELESGLKELNIRVDRGKTQAKLLYLAGDRAL